MLRTVEAYITADRQVAFEEPVELAPGSRVLVTILEDATAEALSIVAAASPRGEGALLNNPTEPTTSLPRPAPYIDLNDEQAVNTRALRAMADVEAGRARTPDQVIAHLQARRTTRAK